MMSEVCAILLSLSSCKFFAHRARQLGLFRKYRQQSLRMLPEVDFYLVRIGDDAIPAHRQDIALRPVQIGGQPIEQPAPPIVVETAVIGLGCQFFA